VARPAPSINKRFFGFLSGSSSAQRPPPAATTSATTSRPAKRVLKYGREVSGSMEAMLLREPFTRHFNEDVMKSFIRGERRRCTWHAWLG
jgi:hypothetical protein